jgi:hypothetical protein
MGKPTASKRRKASRRVGNISDGQKRSKKDQLIESWSFLNDGVSECLSIERCPQRDTVYRDNSRMRGYLRYELAL